MKKEWLISIAFFSTLFLNLIIYKQLLPHDFSVTDKVSSSGQLYLERPANIKLKVEDDLLALPFEKAITVSNGTKHFLFSIIYLSKDSTVSTLSESYYIQSLQLLQKDFRPYELIFIGYSNQDSKLTTAKSTDNFHISSAKECIRVLHVAPLINCLVDLSFKAVDLLYKSLSLKASDVSTIFMTTSNFNLQNYFTPNLAHNFLHIAETFQSSKFFAVSTEVIFSDDAISSNIEALGKKLTIEGLHDIEELVNSNREPFLKFNFLIERNLSKALLFLFSRDSFPDAKNNNYFSPFFSDASLHLNVPVVDISDGAFLIGGTSNVKKKADYFNNQSPEEFGDTLKIFDTLKLYDFQLQCRDLGKCTIVKRKDKNSMINGSMTSEFYADLINHVMMLQNHEFSKVSLLAISEININATFNWICWAKSVGFSHYIFITDSISIKDVLSNLGEAVYYYPINDNRLIESNLYFDLGPDFLNVAKLSNLLGEIQLFLLRRDVNVLVMSPHLLLLNDVTASLELPSCDVGFLTEDAESLFYIKPSEKGIQLLENLIEYRNMQPSRSNAGFTKGVYRYDLYRNVRSLIKKMSIDFQLCKISRGKIVNSEFYFKRPTKRLGSPPFAINLDNNVNASKILNIWDFDNNVCNVPPTITAIPRNIREDWTLRIRILTSYREASFKRLLDSLLNALYEGNIPSIPLDIVVDYPNISDTEPGFEHHMKSYYNIVEAAQQFNWLHGPVNVTVHTFCHGIVYAWLNSEVEPHEVIMILEDDIELSKFYYQYLVKSVEHFYIDPNNYNPRTLGLSFQRQYHVVGETIASFYDPYGPKVIEQVLKSHEIYYKYQLVSSWAPIFFPIPWNLFISWANEKIRGNEPIQCVPFLYSNKWALRGNVWTPFATRFIFEKGLHVIYHQSPDGRAFITNHKEVGLHFDNKTVKEGIIPLINESSQMRHLINSMPPSSKMRLFDFHFQEVSNELSLQLKNEIISHGLDPCITIKRTKRKKQETKSSNLTSLMSMLG